MKKIENVSVATTYEIDSTFDSEKFIKLRIRVCHDGENPNNSHFSLENMNKAKETIKNIPLLAYCYFDDDGNPQLSTHAMHIEIDKLDDTKLRMIYDEIPIGIIPENCNYEVKEYNDRNYVYVDGYVWKNYSNYVQDVIERDKDINISMEIAVDSYIYNKDLGYFDITDYRYTGVTLLGNDVGTGMIDAKATTNIANFEQQKEKMIILMQELKTELALYNKNSEKGGIALAEEIKETVEEVVEEQPTEQPESVNEEVIDTPETEEVVVEEVETKEEVQEEFTEIRFSATYQQKRESIAKAVRQQNADIRDDADRLVKEIYYYVCDFDDDYAYVEKNVWTNDGYSCENGRFNYSFDSETLDATISSDFEKMIVTWLTVDEYGKLQQSRETFENMNAEYEELKEFKANTIKAQYEAQVSDLFAKFDKPLNGMSDYEILKADYSKLDVNQLEEKLYALLGKKNANFSAKPKETIVKLAFESNSHDEGEDPYGGLLARVYNK